MPPHLQALAGVLNSPLAQRARKYWWAALPLGYMAWAYWDGSKKKPVYERLSYVAREMSPVLSLCVTALTLDTMLSARDPAMPAPVVRDAEYADPPEAV